MTFQHHTPPHLSPGYLLAEISHHTDCSRGLLRGCLHHPLGDALVCEGLQVVFAHLLTPSVCNEVSAELLVLHRQVVALDVRNEEVSHKHARNPTDRRNDKRPPLAQIRLNRLERRRAHCGPRLTQRRADAVASSADGGGVGFGGEETQHVAGAEVARGQHKAVEDDEEREEVGCRELVVGEADYEPEDEIAGETEHHGVAAAEAVAEEGLGIRRLVLL